MVRHLGWPRLAQMQKPAVADAQSDSKECRQKECHEQGCQGRDEGHQSQELNRPLNLVRSPVASGGCSLYCRMSYTPGDAMRPSRRDFLASAAALPVGLQIEIGRLLQTHAAHVRRSERNRLRRTLQSSRRPTATFRTLTTSRADSSTAIWWRRLPLPEFGVASAYVEQVKRTTSAATSPRSTASASRRRSKTPLRLAPATSRSMASSSSASTATTPTTRGAEALTRHEYFKQMVEVFEKSGKTVPVF